jgi:predicted NAD/FAD-binding protein
MTQSTPSIAIIGSGISGMGAAWLLREKFAVTVFEKDERLGGHTNTKRIKSAGQMIDVDTGFIVLNDHNYPNFTALLRQLDVPTDASNMSFAISADGGKIEYGTRNIGEIFSQSGSWRQAARWRMVFDLIRFYQGCKWRLTRGRIDGAETLGQYLKRGRYGQFFIQHHILPMAAAIWSVPARTALDFPLRYFLQFCQHHRLLNIVFRPKWRTVRGGARQYINAMLRDGKITTVLNSGITRIARREDGVQIERRDGSSQFFDYLIVATHPDQAIPILSDIDDAERAALSLFRYESNTTYLHRDETYMPKDRRIWSSWNYWSDGGDKLCVTYWMNSLQNLSTLTSILVTLNPPRPPAADKTYAKIEYAHPIYTQDTLRGQQAISAIQGQRRTYFAGAWLGYGFHEDGFKSALAVADALGVRPPWQA